MNLLKSYTPLHFFQRFMSKKLPDYWDLVTGRERYEAIQHCKGNTDPFLSKPVISPPGSGTKDCPIVVPSVYDKRVVWCSGCKLNGMGKFYLHEGFPRRCFCNRWFILERIPYPKVYEDLPD